VHARHPYVGDLVHTAFSGTHQDAIKKGFAEHRARAIAEGRAERDVEWRVPYLPIDPGDIGRSYDAVIRVNSQSGKGGIAYLLENGYDIELPRRLQIDFSRHVQRHADETGSEVTAEQLWDLFQDAYVATEHADIELLDFETTERGTTITLRAGGTAETTSHSGLGPVDALREALRERGFGIEILSLHETRVRQGREHQALALVECREGEVVRWAAGKDRSALRATMQAVMNAAAAPAAIAAR
jgi:2-isopropylmalate synthase